MTFDILRDEGNNVASMFGIVWNFPKDLQDVYLKFGIDLERFNGDNSWTLPMPSRFILDQKGVVRNVEVHPDYTSRPEPEEAVELLKTLF